jgi:hypothetical protein
MQQTSNVDPSFCPPVYSVPSALLSSCLDIELCCTFNHKWHTATATTSYCIVSQSNYKAVSRTGPDLHNLQNHRSILRGVVAVQEKHMLTDNSKGALTAGLTPLIPLPQQLAQAPERVGRKPTCETRRCQSAHALPLRPLHPVNGVRCPAARLSHNGSLPYQNYHNRSTGVGAIEHIPTQPRAYLRSGDASAS